MERQPQCVLEVVDARDVGRGHRPAAMPDDGRRRDPARHPQVCQRHLNREVGHLRQLRQRDARRRFVGRQLVEERPAGVRPECRVAALQHLSEDRLGLAQLPTHPPPLRPHAGKYEGDTGRASRRGPSRRQARAACTDSEVGQQLGEVVPARGDDRQSKIVMGTTFGAGEADVAHAGLGFAAQMLRVLGRQGIERLWTSCREDEQARGVAFGGLERQRTPRRLLQHGVGIGATETERVDACKRCPPGLGPRFQCRDDSQAERAQIEGFVRLMKMQRGRDRAAL